MVSEKEGVAAKVLATTDDLEAIAHDDEANVPALQGWRKPVFGDHALALKHGKLALGIKDGKWILSDQGPLAKRKLDAHDTQPALADLDGDGRKDLVIGAEDGRIYVQPQVLQK
jgi:DNA-binding SARP family transcriptional activator